MLMQDCDMYYAVYCTLMFLVFFALSGSLCLPLVPLGHVQSM